MKNPYLQEVTEIIRKQQGPRGPVWMCGEQLLEMIAPDEAAAKLVLDDLKHGGMSLKACEANIRAFAQKNGSCCTGQQAVRLCFYCSHNYSPINKRFIYKFFSCYF